MWKEIENRLGLFLLIFEQELALRDKNKESRNSCANTNLCQFANKAAHNQVNKRTEIKMTANNLKKKCLKQRIFNWTVQNSLQIFELTFFVELQMDKYTVTKTNKKTIKH